MEAAIAFSNAVAIKWAAWMLHISWQVALLGGIVWVATTLLRKSSAGFRYLLWLIVFCKLILPPALSTPWSLGNIIPKVSVVDRVLTSDTAEWPAIADLSRHPPEQGKNSPSEHASLRPLTLLMFGWASVALGLFALLAVQYRRYARKITKNLSLPAEDLQNTFSSLANALKVRDDVPLGLSPAVDTPALFGFLRPAILLPRSSEQQFSPTELSSILAHELAHIKRRDLVVGGLAALLTCLYWFNPVVWIANLHLRREREMACDDLVLQTTRHEGRQYASTILRVAELFTGSVPAGAGFLGLLEISDNLLWRVRSAANELQPRRLSWVAVLAIALIAALFVPMGILAPQSYAAAPSGAPLGPPRIVSTSPAMGASNVDPTTKEIRVTFDQDMGGGWAAGRSIQRPPASRNGLTSAPACCLWRWRQESFTAWGSTQRATRTFEV